MVTKYIAANKFKTNTISMFFEDNLSKDRAAGNALVPMLLRRGCKKYPMLLDISRRLEELYGATFSFETFKKGESQFTHFSIEYLSDKYTGTGGKLYDEITKLLMGIVYDPLLIGSKAFRPDYTSQEIDNLKNIIRSRINDKRRYAQDRCIEEMCKGEPFSISEVGSEEDLDGIGPEQAYSRYKDISEAMPLTVYIAGDVEEEKRNEFFSRFASREQTQEREIPKTLSLLHKPKKVKEVTEKLDVNQGKLCLGFRTGFEKDGGNKNYPAMLVFNSIFGEGSSMHSKLFLNIREKESMAYYISSRMERFKGIMLVNGGIESANRNKAVELVLRQLESIRKGEISDYEMKASKDKIDSTLETVNDSLLSMIAYDLNCAIAGKYIDIETMREIVKEVTVDDVIKIADGIILDTIYFLSPK